MRFKRKQFEGSLRQQRERQGQNGVGESEESHYRNYGSGDNDKQWR